MKTFAKGSRVVNLPKALQIAVARTRKKVLWTPPEDNALLCHSQLAKKMKWNMMSW